MTNHMIIPGIMTIGDAVAQVWGINKIDLSRKTNLRGISEPRNVAMWWEFQHTKKTKALIAGSYGLDHATAHHAWNIINDLRLYNPILNEKIHRVCDIMDNVKQLTS